MILTYTVNGRLAERLEEFLSTNGCRYTVKHYSNDTDVICDVDEKTAGMMSAIVNSEKEFS